MLTRLGLRFDMKEFGNALREGVGTNPAGEPNALRLKEWPQKIAKRPRRNQIVLVLVVVLEKRFFPALINYRVSASC